MPTRDMSRSLGESDDRTVDCYGCGKTISIADDEWWQYSWEEHPSSENVEKAIGDRNFRDWIRENYVFCPECHKRIQSVVEI